MKNNIDFIIAKLQLLWMNEDVRLSDRERELCEALRSRGFDPENVIEYIGVCANRRYFKSYIFEVLKYIEQLAQ